MLHFEELKNLEEARLTWGSWTDQSWSLCGPIVSYRKMPSFLSKSKSSSSNPSPPWGSEYICCIWSFVASGIQWKIQKMDQSKQMLKQENKIEEKITFPFFLNFGSVWDTTQAG